jgi:cytochrome bd-type quinol oxidase subunit 2
MTVRRATSAIALSLLAAIIYRGRPSQVLDHPGRRQHFAAAMAIGHLLLFFLACGVATFPLTLIAMRVVASLSTGGRIARKADDAFEKALTVSIIVWVLGAFAFYGVALYIERQKDCAEQRTTQLTYECRKLYGQKDL